MQRAIESFVNLMAFYFTSPVKGLIILQVVESNRPFSYLSHEGSGYIAGRGI